MSPAVVAVAASVALLAPVFAAGLVRRRRYRAFCRTSPVRDDRIVCRGAHARRDLKVAGDGFDPPPGLTARGQTAFLTLMVRATVAGGVVDPFIEVSHGGRSFRQYFDRGARGRRHLNLSPIFQSARVQNAGVQDAGVQDEGVQDEGVQDAGVLDAGAPLGRVRLRGHALGWDADAELSLFEPPPIAGARLLVLAPHPDDAEIGCFGLYAEHPSWIVSLTAGDAGTADLSAVLPSRADNAAWYARLRVWNSLTIPRLGSVPAERCLNLAYPDGALRSMWRTPAQTFALACEPAVSRASLRATNVAPEFGTAADCRWQALIDDLRRVLDIARPDVVIAPHPTMDEHPDHVFTTVALDQALRAAGARPQVFLYAVHHAGARLFPFGPATAMASLAPASGTDWIADGLYSHPLSPQRRLAKYFAVDANSDLRAHASGNPTRGELLGGIKRRLSALVTGVGLDPIAYQRRAPRPDEIYYLADTGALSELVARALGPYEPA